jgi:hypothetical protein
MALSIVDPALHSFEPQRQVISVSEPKSHFRRECVTLCGAPFRSTSVIDARAFSRISIWSVMFLNFVPFAPLHTISQTGMQSVFCWPISSTLRKIDTKAISIYQGVMGRMCYELPPACGMRTKNKQVFRLYLVCSSKSLRKPQVRLHESSAVAFPLASVLPCIRIANASEGQTALDPMTHGEADYYE